MSTQPLGLAEYKVKHLDIEEMHYVTRLVSEPPNFKLIRYWHRYYYVPLPWTHYLLLKSADTKKRTWMLYSIYMSPRHLTDIKFRKVSQPIIPNLYDYHPIFRPCQKDGTKYQDINKLITSFWDGNFNNELLPTGHPVVKQIANGVSVFMPAYFERWEALSIEKLLEMQWPQNVRI